MSTRQKLSPTVAMLLLVASSSFATEYYVSKTGSNKNPGTKSAPFLTIQKAADMMKPGDICSISAGIYPESVSPRNSGTESNPIIYRAASDKDHVVITGADPIPGSKWKKETAHIFKAKVEMALDHENQVFLGEKPMVEARWPNMGDDLMEPVTSSMDEGSTPENIVDNEMPDYDYSGGHVWVHSKPRWGNWTGRILSHSNKSIGIENLAPSRHRNLHVAREGADYFVFGVKDALDADNEWFYDKNTKELSIFRSNGRLPDEEYLVKKRMNAFDFSGRKHIELHDLDIFGATILTDEESESILLDGLRILYLYHYDQCNEHYSDIRQRSGVIIKGKKCKIQNSEVGYSASSCILLLGEENMVFNCYVHNANTMGSRGAGCITLGGKGNIISHSTLTRAGRSVLSYHGMYKALIQNNDMSHSGQLCSDLGLTYGWLIKGGNSELRYNLLHDNDDEHRDMGLYYDHGNYDIITHHNIIWGVGRTAFTLNHYNAYHLVYNNTFIADQYGFRSHWGKNYKPDLLECRFANNVFSPNASTNAGNYYWNANITGYDGFDGKNVMKPAEAGLGRGMYIEGITASPKGTKPGIGAIEYEGMSFKAGHDFENPPQNVNFERSKPAHRNLIENSTFEKEAIEKEDFLSPWIIRDGACLKQHQRRDQLTGDTGLCRAGVRSIELVASNSEVYQQVNELIPGEEYTFIGHLRVEKKESAFIGVRFPDGSEFISPQVMDSTIAPSGTEKPSDWRRCRLSFILPEGVTSVEVFARRTSSGKKSVHVDDFGLVRR